MPKPNKRMLSDWFYVTLNRKVRRSEAFGYRFHPLTRSPLRAKGYSWQGMGVKHYQVETTIHLSNNPSPNCTQLISEQIEVAVYEGWLQM